MPSKIKKSKKSQKKSAKSKTTYVILPQNDKLKHTDAQFEPTSVDLREFEAVLDPIEDIDVVLKDIIVLSGLGRKMTPEQERKYGEPSYSVEQTPFHIIRRNVINNRNWKFIKKYTQEEINFIYPATTLSDDWIQDLTAFAKKIDFNFRIEINPDFEEFQHGKCFFINLNLKSSNEIDWEEEEQRKSEILSMRDGAHCRKGVIHEKVCIGDNIILTDEAMENYGMKVKRYYTVNLIANSIQEHRGYDMGVYPMLLVECDDLDLALYENEFEIEKPQKGQIWTKEMELQAKINEEIMLNERAEREAEREWIFKQLR